MAKKEKPKPKESGNWKPSTWTFMKLRGYMRHVCRHAWDDAVLILGRLEGSAALAAFLTDAKDRESAALMKHFGIHTIGDVQRDEARNVQR